MGTADGVSWRAGRLLRGGSTMDRRKFLQLGAVAAICGGAAVLRYEFAGRESDESHTPPVFSVIPVVGDGKWIWNTPPQGQTGYLEPRPYLLDVGIELVGKGSTGEIMASTPVPIPCPEQKIEEQRIETQGCQAEIRDLAPDARQLLLSAPRITAGQTIKAVAHYKLTLYKQYHNYQRDQFPQEQKIPNDVRRQYLGESPGIQTRCKEVRQLLEKLAGDGEHPWDLAKKFATWIPRNIRPQIGPFTGVAKVLDSRLGDCAEMSAIFVALSRAAGIPARLVWVPDHNWSEFYLTDKQGQGHWIPAHGLLFLVRLDGGPRAGVAKGRPHSPAGVGQEAPSPARRLVALADRAAPSVRYLAELTPQAASAGGDPGPAPAARSPAASGS